MFRYSDLVKVTNNLLRLNRGIMIACVGHPNIKGTASINWPKILIYHLYEPVPVVGSIEFPMWVDSPTFV